MLAKDEENGSLVGGLLAGGELSGAGGGGGSLLSPVRHSDTFHEGKEP